MMIDPGSLAYDDHGEGIPVVLLHGLTFDRGAWRPVGERLGDGVRSIAFDLPGHGDSGGELPRALVEVADAIGGALDALEIRDPVLVGHSISAVICLIYAASRPVRGVVDVDQPLNPRPFAELVQSIEPALRGGDFSAAFRRFQDGMRLDLLDDATRAAILARQTIDRDLVLAYWNDLLTTDAAALQARSETLMAALDAPFLGIFSRELGDAERRFLFEHLRDAEIEEWPGRGHLGFATEPDRYAARLRALALRGA
jgi:pimeloyl-ACP methyl ester carboxylesterase